MGVITESLRFLTGEAEVSLRDVATGAEEAGSKAGKLAGALDLASPAAGSLARLAGDLGDALSLAATPAGAIGLAVAAVGAVALGAVAGVGALAVGIVELTRGAAGALPDLRELQRVSGVGLVDEKAGAAIERATGALDAMNAAGSALSVVLAAELAPGVESLATLGVQAALGLRDLLDPLSQMKEIALGLGKVILDGLTAPINGLIFALGALFQKAAEAADALGQGGLAAQLREVGAATLVTGYQGVAGASWDALVDGLSGYREEAEKLVTAQTSINRGTDNGAAERQLAALNKQRDALLGTLDLFRELELLQAESAVGLGATDIRTTAAAELAVLEQRATALGAAASSVRDPFIDLQLLAMDIGEALAKGPNAELENLLDNVEEAAAALERLKQEQARVTQLGAATAGLNAAGGDLLGLLGVMGPQGAAASAALGALRGVGQKGAEGVNAEVTSLFSDLTAGVEALPQILGEVLPKAIGEGLPTLVEALVEAAPELAVASLKAQVQLVEMLMTDLPQAVGEGVWTAVERLWQMIKDFLSHPVDSLLGGGKGNGFWGGARNTAVDIGRIAAGVATLGLSEVAWGAANAATKGGVKNAAYGGTRDRSARGSPMEARGTRGVRLQLDVARVFNGSDRRDNLESTTNTTRYGPHGPTRS